MRKQSLRLRIDNDTWLEACNIGNGDFMPLNGFMGSADYTNVVENMHLRDGAPWTIPVTLDVPEVLVANVMKSDQLILTNHRNEDVALLMVEDVYKVDYEKDLVKIFGIDDIEHPGVKKEIGRSEYRVGGEVNVVRYIEDEFSGITLTPKQTKKIFKQAKWNTITGFQTRNPIHRAHEYLQRLAMEITDGVFIQPLIGWKKCGDFAPTAIVSTYREMIDKFYPANRVVFSTLRTPMRYAGPREAVFHAIIRRNYGCTHFIVGRDHAGVGGYYGKYDAHKLCSTFDDLGIEILAFCGPYYCNKCACIVTEKTCQHGEESSLSISGTQLRNMIMEGTSLPIEYVREEISNLLLALGKEDSLFIHDNDII